jgi:hypothetical protein
MRMSAGASASKAIPRMRSGVIGSFSTSTASTRVMARLSWITGPDRLAPIAWAARKLP